MSQAQSPPQPAAVPAPERDERSLLVAIAAGDRDAACELVDRSYSMIYGALFRLCGDDELAADLTQETYRKAWAALARFDGRARFSTWLYRIAHNTFLNHVRRPRRVVPMEEGHGLDPADPEPGADELVEQQQEGRRIRRAVLELPAELRFAVTARYWGEVPVREIARVEGITEPAVRKRLKRALKILGHSMEVAS